MSGQGIRGNEESDVCVAGMGEDVCSSASTLP